MEDERVYGTSSKPWMKCFSKKNIDMPLPQFTMYGMVKHGCDFMNKENDTAIYYFGTRFTYHGLFRSIETYAAAFKEYGINKGDCVSFLAVSLPETIFSIYALNKLGAVCNFIDVRTDAKHVREFIRKAKSDVLVVLDRSFGSVKNYLDELGLRLVICQSPKDSLPMLKKIAYKIKAEKPDIPYDNKRVIPNSVFAKAGVGKSVQDIAYEPDMPAVITRTGGTTGVSKGVVLTNDSMNAIAHNFAVSCLEKVPRERSLLNFLPLGSSYGIAVGIHMALSLGCEDILIPNFKPEEFDKLVIKYRPNHIIAVPTFYQQLITSERLKGKDLSFIQTMAAGGDTANEALEDRLEKFRLEHGIQYPVSQGYGMSELSSAVSFGFQNTCKRGSAGIPSITSTIAAFKPGTTEELPLGEKGELCVTGASLMKEYLDEPEETANIMWKHPDGKVWVHTGDLGYVDEDGFIFIVGRIKRAIIRFDGHKVYPLQLERLVMQHIKVKNCVVVSIKDRQHEQGALPLVIVELVNPAYNSKELIDELKEYIMQEIELRSQPADVVVVNEIPLTKLAKNDYRAMEEKFKEYDYLKK